MPGYSFSNLAPRREAFFATPFPSFPLAMSPRMPRSGKTSSSSFSMWALRSLASFSAMLPVLPDRCCIRIRSCHISRCSFSIDEGADSGIRATETLRYLSVPYTLKHKLSLGPDDDASGRHVAYSLLLLIRSNQQEPYQVDER